MADSEASKTVKAGSRTFFFDLKRTRDSKPYLIITESSLKGEGKDRERKSLTVFQDHAQEFRDALEEMMGHLE